MKAERILNFLSIVFMSVILLLLYDHHRLRLKNRELQDQAQMLPTNRLPNMSYAIIHTGLTREQSSNLYSEALRQRTNREPKWFYIGSNPPVKLSFYGDSPSKETVAAIEKWLVEFNKSDWASNMHTWHYDRFTLTWPNEP